MALRRQHHEAVADLCARLFAEPGRLADRIAHPVEGEFRITPHRHDDVLQLDLLDRIDGTVFDGTAWRPVSGLSLLVQYPGDMHGYRLVGRRGSRMCHLKLAVRGDWRIARLRPWPRITTQLPAMQRLVAAAFDAARQPLTKEERPPTLLATLSLVLALWPGVGVSAGEAEAAEDARDLAAAVALVRQRLDDPPGAEELARACDLSVRHLGRRFRQHFGCTPLAFVHAARLDAAKTLLLGGRHSVAHVADRLGFSSHAAFTRWFRQHSGTTPSHFRESPMSA